MTGASEEEQQLLESRLSKALEEASSKTAIAAASIGSRKEGYERDVWAAAEAAEYASLIFALTHGLEDTNPTGEVTRKRVEDPASTVEESVKALEMVRNTKPNEDRSSIETAYRSLRQAVVGLRNSYLTITRKSSVEKE